MERENRGYPWTRRGLVFIPSARKTPVRPTRGLPQGLGGNPQRALMATSGDGLFRRTVRGLSRLSQDRG